MPLVALSDMVRHAYRHHYAVGSFGIDNQLLLEGVLLAAEELRAPVVLNLIATHYTNDELESFIPIVVQAARRSAVPVAVNVSHVKDTQLAERVLSTGCNGVMIDYSSLDFAENVRHTAEFVKQAHLCGVSVEGCLGHVPDEQATDETDGLILTAASEVRAYVERTGVDSLAISIGNIHGYAKGAKIDFSRLNKIHQSVDIPLVLHGGTGLSQEQYRKAIDAGVAKINYYTGLTDTISKHLRFNLEANRHAGYQDLMQGISDAVRSEAAQCIAQWRSDGRAAEVSSQCRTISEVVYMATFSLASSGLGKLGIGLALQEAQQSLGGIPGVRQVSLGASKEQASGRYCLIVALANETAAENFLVAEERRQVTSRLALSFDLDWADGLFVRVEQGTHNAKWIGGHVADIDMNEGEQALRQ